MQLERYESNGLELLIDKSIGEVYASQSAVARMCKVSESTIRNFVSSHEYTPKIAEIPTAQNGIKKASLFDEEVILLVLAKYNLNLINTFINTVKQITGKQLLIPLISSKLDKKKKTRLTYGFIYLFESVHMIKLGFSKNPKKRLKTLERWPGELELVNAIQGSEVKERQLHSLLQQTGEYFGGEWYPTYRKHEILKLLSFTDSDLSKSDSDIKQCTFN